MSMRKIDKSECESYFNTLSKALQDKMAEIEIMAMGTMDKKQTHWIKINGISYNPEEDVLFIFCENLEHRIKKALEFKVWGTDDSVDKVEIVGSDGYSHLLTFKNPVKLS
ncbi:MAG TPA: hypothetical protein ENK33_07595 [Desulfobacterales bacterium]|nr:hypothetical protein [Desulfobacterales bacterium]